LYRDFAYLQLGSGILLVIMFSEKFKQKLWQGVLIGLLSMVLSFVMFLPASAADYNCGAYGAGAYQSSACGTDGLSDTGQPVWQILIAAGLILAGVYLIIRSRKNMKSRVKARKAENPVSSE
jgi:hypothetical protein